MSSIRLTKIPAICKIIAMTQRGIDAVVRKDGQVVGEFLYSLEKLKES